MADLVPFITAEELENARGDGLLCLVQCLIACTKRLDRQNKELQATVCMLPGDNHQSFSQVHNLLKDVFHLSMSIGSIPAVRLGECPTRFLSA